MLLFSHQKEPAITPSNISFINTAAYQQACKEKEVRVYQLTPDTFRHRTQMVTIDKKPPELGDLPKEYHKFC